MPAADNCIKIPAGRLHLGHRKPHSGDDWTQFSMRSSWKQHTKQPQLLLILNMAPHLHFLRSDRRLLFPSGSLFADRKILMGSTTAALLPRIDGAVSAGRSARRRTNPFLIAGPEPAAAAGLKRDEKEKGWPRHTHVTARQPINFRTSSVRELRG